MSEKLLPQSPVDRESLMAVPYAVDDSIPDLLNRKVHEFPKHSYAPTYYHGLMTILTDEMPTVDKSISPEVLLPLTYPHDELARTAIINFLDSRFAPIYSARRDRTYANSETVDRKRLLDRCCNAEHSFTRMFDSMRESIHPETEDYSMYTGWTIVMGDDNVPIAIRKPINVPSTLSLVPLFIDGSAYPAGSLFDMRLHEDRRMEEDSVRSKLKLTTPHQNVSSIRFLRLSAFAHEPEERAALFTNLSSIKSTARLPLAKITELAQKCVPISSRVGFKD